MELCVLRLAMNPFFLQMVDIMKLGERSVWNVPSD